MESITHLWHLAMAAIGAAHPLVLFVALAVLPLLGVPTSPLWIAIGVGAGTMRGSGLALVALVANYSIGYWLSRRWLRRPLTIWLGKRKWRLPKVSASDEGLIILVFRITPGIPLFVQNYALGLAEVSFGRYLMISTLIQTPQVIAFVWFGNSLAGNAIWKSALAIGAIVALALVVVLLRRSVKRRMSSFTERPPVSAAGGALSSNASSQTCP